MNFIKKIKSCVAFLLLLISTILYSQSSIDNILNQIEKNNTLLKATQSYNTAKSESYKTGLTPYDPKVDFDYLKGSPANAGNQTDFAVTQSFDFWTSYGKRKSLAKELTSQNSHQYDNIRYEVLLKANLTCYELIYHNKLKNFLEKRKTSLDKLYNDFERKLSAGEGNILDVNKIKIQLIELNSRIKDNNTIIVQLNQNLTLLNGGESLTVSDTIYPVWSTINDEEVLIKNMLAKNPSLKYMEQDITIADKKIDLTKSLTYPKIEAGYHYQSILGQKFNGLHLGMTLPLWEHRNKVDTEKAMKLYTEATLQDYTLTIKNETQTLIESAKNQKSNMDELRLALSNLNTKYLLDKSLSVGEISAIEYFMDLGYYNDANEKLLLLEKEYNLKMAELMRYE